MIKIVFDDKGQASAELILVTVVFIVIAGSLASLTGSEMDKTDTGNLGQARMIGETVAETINTVYTNGPGYSANLTLPQLKSAYTVYIYNTGNINVLYNGNNMSIDVIPTNISSPVLTNGTSHQVRNNNGTIVIT